jgi:hypothetical protein
LHFFPTKILIFSAVYRTTLWMNFTCVGTAAPGCSKPAKLC